MSFATTCPTLKLIAVQGARVPARCAGQSQHFSDCRQQVLTMRRPMRSLTWVDIEASARKHGVSDDDMLHALRHHWRGFETDDPDVTMFIGPSATGEPLEVGVVDDADGVAIIHAMPARSKFLKGWWTP